MMIRFRFRKINFLILRIFSINTFALTLFLIKLLLLVFLFWKSFEFLIFLNFFRLYIYDFIKIIYTQTFFRRTFTTRIALTLWCRLRIFYPFLVSRNFISFWFTTSRKRFSFILVNSVLRTFSNRIRWLFIFRIRFLISCIQHRFNILWKLLSF